jgi:hypothetical protein
MKIDCHAPSQSLAMTKKKLKRKEEEFMSYKVGRDLAISRKQAGFHISKAAWLLMAIITSHIISQMYVALMK